MTINQKMKAAVYYKYGSPENINIVEVDVPAPGDGEVLVKVKAASVNAYDWRLLKASPFFTRVLSGLLKPKNNIPGSDIAGVVAATGNGAAKFKVGDEVFGCLEGCGKGGLATGGYAEYVCAKEAVLAPKSDMLSFEEAAALPMASVTALQSVRDYAKLQQGQSVLINGASGGVGMFAVQIAKACGAEVTGVCSTGSVETVRSLGADYVIDYTKESAAPANNDNKNYGRRSDNHNDIQVKKLNDIQSCKFGEKQYDVVIDVAGTLSVRDYRRALKPDGICVVVGFSTIRHLISYSLARTRDGKKIVLCAANNKIDSPLQDINKLIEEGKVKVIIDSRFPLDETVDALRRAESGHPTGKVVIYMA
jgi:NADPH:quinone reductase-like Zn-dependent oxidoreductase